MSPKGCRLAHNETAVLAGGGSAERSLFPGKWTNVDIMEGGGPRTTRDHPGPSLNPAPMSCRLAAVSLRARFEPKRRSKKALAAPSLPIIPPTHFFFCCSSSFCNLFMHHYGCSCW